MCVKSAFTYSDIDICHKTPLPKKNMNHADFCMHLYDAIYNIPKSNWFNCVIIQYRQLYYTQYNALECRGIPNEGPAQSKIVLVFSRAKTSCSPPSECAQIHPAFLIEIIELGKWRKISKKSWKHLKTKYLSKWLTNEASAQEIKNVLSPLLHWTSAWAFWSLDWRVRQLRSDASPCRFWVFSIVV